MIRTCRAIWNVNLFESGLTANSIAESGPAFRSAGERPRYRTQAAAWQVGEIGVGPSDYPKSARGSIRRGQTSCLPKKPLIGRQDVCPTALFGQLPIVGHGGHVGLRDNLTNDVAVDVRQAEVAARVAVSQTFVVET